MCIRDRGWHGDAAVSVIVGGAGAGRPEDLELIAATEDSLWAGAAALAVGAPLQDVGAAVEDSIHASGAVSYTHLDVYKRQTVGRGGTSARGIRPGVPDA